FFVILASETQITVIGSRGRWRRRVLRLSDAEADVPRLEQSEKFVVVSRFMTELECGTHRGKFAQKRIQHVRVFLERGRQLKQNWPESLAEASHHFAKIIERICAIEQLRPMRDFLRCLQRK